MQSQHSHIADELTSEILTARYQPGDRLPSERDLAGRFDANRGAVREAMKVLQQRGLIDIQPGGARVNPVEEASLDVISHLLALGEVPDTELVDQVLAVMGTLIELAASTAVERASDQDLERITSSIEALLAIDAESSGYVEARFALLGAFMEVSGNLACQLIARSLLLQFVPRLTHFSDYVEPTHDIAIPLLTKLLRAVVAREGEQVRLLMRELSALNRQTVVASLEKAEQALPAFKEAQS
ncbi:MAG: GntR family transcriptional regulator [Pseudomonadaceae bacterium]|nr:GntR family transcriptional regulator [Pseudomonadaceae bacterium]